MKEGTKSVVIEKYICCGSLISATVWFIRNLLGMDLSMLLTTTGIYMVPTVLVGGLLTRD